MTTTAPRVAVLRDYPLRLWFAQNEYFEGLMREYRLLLDGEESAHAPRRLVELAAEIEGRFGGVLQTVNAERQRALDSGLDRIDFAVPLSPGLPEVLEHVRVALEESDAYCRAGRLLSLPRSPLLVAFGTWTGTELRAQYDGSAPTPWPGPF